MLMVFLAVTVSAAESVVGLWRGVDENSGESTMFTYIYEYQGKLYGRMVVTFDEGVQKDMINRSGERAELGEPLHRCFRPHLGKAIPSMRAWTLSGAWKIEVIAGNVGKSAIRKRVRFTTASSGARAAILS